MGDFAFRIRFVVFPTHQVNCMAKQPEVNETHPESEKHGTHKKPCHHQGEFESRNFPEEHVSQGGNDVFAEEGVDLLFKAWLTFRCVGVTFRRQELIGHCRGEDHPKKKRNHIQNN